MIFLGYLAIIHRTACNKNRFCQLSFRFGDSEECRLGHVASQFSIFDNDWPVFHIPYPWQLPASVGILLSFLLASLLLVNGAGPRSADFKLLDS